MSEKSSSVEDRCRLILVVNEHVLANISADSLSNICAAGDIASLMLVPGTLDEARFQPLAEPVVAAAQNAGIAVIVCDQSRTAGRLGADGFQLGQDPQALEEAIEKYKPAMMVGASNVKTRHNALVIGELQPDYLMFGKPGGDIRPEPHPKNIDLGKWWSELVEIPCIVLGGDAVESVVEVAKCGAEFVALDAAIFGAHEGNQDLENAPARVAKANRLLDEHAPRFDDVED